MNNDRGDPDEPIAAGRATRDDEAHRTEITDAYESLKRAYERLKALDKTRLDELQRVRRSVTLRIENKVVVLLRLSGLLLDVFKKRHKQKASVPGTPTGAPGNKAMRDSIVFFPTNGVGLGHFTRLLAIATRIKRRQPNYEIVFCTPSPILHVCESLGFVSYHIPHRSTSSEGLGTGPDWNWLLDEVLTLVINTHKPRLFVFDGVQPYWGLLNVLQRNPSMKTVWVRRGMYKTDAGSFLNACARTLLQKTHGHRFDCMIQPGDAVSHVGADHQQGFFGSILECNPILYPDQDDGYSRNRIRNILGVPEKALLVLVALGAGQVNDVTADLHTTLSVLSRFDQVYTVVSESLLGKRFGYDYPRVRVLRDYPNALYYKAVDFSVQAAGYNSYHEMVQFGIPTLCYPNLEARTDDQLARANVSAANGNMIVLTEVNKETVSAAVYTLMDSRERATMRTAAFRLAQSNGADEVANYLLTALESGFPKAGDASKPPAQSTGFSEPS